VGSAATMVFESKASVPSAEKASDVCFAQSGPLTEKP
jgi:hypothetical protein